MSDYWLGLDCGGSWLKAGLYDREGREAGVERLPLRTLQAQQLIRIEYGGVRVLDLPGLRTYAPDSRRAGLERMAT